MIFLICYFSTFSMLMLDLLIHQNNSYGVFMSKEYMNMVH